MLTFIVISGVVVVYLPDVKQMVKNDPGPRRHLCASLSREGSFGPLSGAQYLLEELVVHDLLQLSRDDPLRLLQHLLPGCTINLLPNYLIT
jgi:hypothetical protein